ncbi:MAG: metalloregulator ArsR/SmtB family transcription factor [Actinomycetota bacterium]|nr:metalloregulator ArsR/SmtB family transcription factor [Actinomycetota bacterium]
MFFVACRPNDPVQLLAGPLSEGDANELAGILKVLADPVRLRLVSIVASSATGEACACDFTAPLDRSQPTISHHLGQLVTAGILEREQRGKWAWFRLNDQSLDAVHRALGRPNCC